MREQGIYKVKATKWGFTETSKSGYPQFWMTGDVLGRVDEHNTTAVKPCQEGTCSWSITPTSDESERWLIGTVQHLGFDRDELLALDPDSEGAFDFTGTRSTSPTLFIRGVGTCTCTW